MGTAFDGSSDWGRCLEEVKCKLMLGKELNLGRLRTFQKL